MVQQFIERAFAVTRWWCCLCRGYHRPQNVCNTKLTFGRYHVVKNAEMALKILDMLGLLRKNYKIMSESLKFA